MINYPQELNAFEFTDAILFTFHYTVQTVFIIYYLNSIVKSEKNGICKLEGIQLLGGNLSFIG